MDCFECCDSCVSSYLRKTSCTHVANLAAIDFRFFSSVGCKMDFCRIDFVGRFSNYSKIARGNSV